MAMAIEAFAEWARIRGIVSPCGEVETGGMPTFQSEVKTTMTNDTPAARMKRIQELGPQPIYDESGNVIGEDSGILSIEQMAALLAHEPKAKAMYLTEDETTDVRNHRLQSRAEQEVWFRSQGHFDWADRTRDNTAVLANGGEIQRRRGGTRDDEL